MTDPRSTEARAYRKLYDTARWKRLRETQLRTQPLCEWCMLSEVIEPATVVHHGDGGHKGDVDKFWAGPFVSLCAPCHDRDGKLDDKGKKIIRFDALGWPIG